MSRRRRPEKREILPDPKFGDIVLSKFMNSVMLDGKKSVAESIVYTALDSVEARLKKDPLAVFHDALNNVKPGIEVRSRRVGGATYQVPVEVRPERRTALAMRDSASKPRMNASMKSRPDFCTRLGLVVTPSSNPVSASSRISAISAVSAKNFMADRSLRLCTYLQGDSEPAHEGHPKPPSRSS